MTQTQHQLSSKSYSAKRLAKGALVCPACQLRIEEPVLICPSCGFSGQNTLDTFSSEAPPMEQIMDMAGLWDSTQKEFLNKKIARMRRIFPQIHWCLLTVSLPADVDLRLFGFWFFNVSTVTGADAATDRAWTVLLVVDPQNHRVTVTPGYAVEPFIADDEWEKSLVAMYSFWKKDDPVRACAEFFEHVKSLLIDSAARVKKLVTREKGGKR